MEIPRELRDRLHLTPGALVDLQPGENGFSVTPVSNGAVFVPATTTLVREGSLLVFGGSAPLSLEDVNRAIGADRIERSLGVANEGVDIR